MFIPKFNKYIKNKSKTLTETNIDKFIKQLVELLQSYLINEKKNTQKKVKQKVPDTLSIIKKKPMIKELSKFDENEYLADTKFMAKFIIISAQYNKILSKKEIDNLTAATEILSIYKKNDIIKNIFSDLSITLNKISVIFNITEQKVFENLFEIICKKNTEKVSTSFTDKFELTIENLYTLKTTNNFQIFLNYLKKAFQEKIY